MMCKEGCTHGTTVYIPPGHLVFTWPATDTATTQAIEDLTIIRGRD